MIRTFEPKDVSQLRSQELYGDYTNQKVRSTVGQTQFLGEWIKASTPATYWPNIGTNFIKSEHPGDCRLLPPDWNPTCELWLTMDHVQKPWMCAKLGPFPRIGQLVVQNIDAPSKACNSAMVNCKIKHFKTMTLLSAFMCLHTHARTTQEFVESAFSCIFNTHTHC